MTLKLASVVTNRSARVLEVAEGMAGSAFTAVENRYCAMCPVRTSCPVQDDGRAVTG